MTNYSQGLKYRSNKDGTCAIIGVGTCTDKKIIIPTRSPKEELVTSIGDIAFYNCTTRESIEIPASVTSIGWGAFYNCASLASITIPASVTNIGEYVFCGCPSLESITVANGNAKYHSAGNCIIETESKTLIMGCKNSVIPIDGSVMSIGDRAFYNCASLASITIPAGVTSVGFEAFRGCTSLTRVTIPASVTSIEKFAFYHCANLKSIAIPAGVTSISAGAFSDCTSLTRVTIPAGVTSIGRSAFYGCTSLTSIEIPAGVTSVGNDAFYRCASLKSVTFAKNSQLSGIGEDAFRNCVSLNSEVQAYKAFLLGPRRTLYSKQNHQEYQLNHKSFVRGPLECCTNGLHYCTKLFDIFNYYSGEYGEDFVIAICDVSEENVGHKDDSKRCARWIRPTKILTREEVIQLLNTRKKE